jgi:hypothetical protein
MVSAAGDYAMVLEGQNTFTTKILKHNPSGQYEQVYSRNEYAAVELVTNGRWFCVVDATISIAEIFKLDENGNPVDSAIINGLPDDSNGLFFKILSDDSFLAITPSEVYTFAQSANGTWQIENVSPLLFSTLKISGDSPSIHVTDEFIVGIELMNNSVYFFARQRDMSWNLRSDLTMSFDPETHSPYNVAWNGVDTLFLSNYEYEETFGALWIFVQSDESGWGLANTISGTEQQYFGYTLQLMFADILVVSSPLDGSSTAALNGGSATVIQRFNDDWQTITDIQANDKDVLFGMTVVQNDWDVLFYSCSGNDFPNYDCALFSYPICEPTSVTCHDVESTTMSDCNAEDESLSNIQQFFTVNNNACGSVMTSFTKHEIGSNKVRVDLSFSRDDSTAACQSIVTCRSASTSSIINVPIVLVLFVSILSVLY